MFSQQAAVEAVYSTTYVEDYLDAVVDLPDDLQKHLSRLREYDAECNRHVREVERLMDVLISLKEKKDAESETAAISISTRLQSLLVRTQEIGDQKLGVVQQIQDMLENKTSQLDIDQKNSEYVKPEPMESTTKLDSCEKKRARRARHDVFVQASLGPTMLEPTSYPDQPVPEAPPRTMMPPIPSTSHAAAATQHHMSPAKAGPSTSSSEKVVERERASWGAQSDRTTTATATAAAAKVKQQQEKKIPEADKKKQYKRRKTNSKQTGNSNSPPSNMQIDPDEPTYCLCDQVSYGDMIGCDNDLCPIEWFHFSCVSLTTKPKGKWYCPKCRGDRATLMKPKALFMKELEKYNREREEKA